MDSPNPFSNSGGFVDLLNSTEVPVFSSQWSDDPSEAAFSSEDKKGRRNWSPKEDVVLISAWLNTSKDPLVGNEQKAEAFWKRVAAYFTASPKLVGMQKREAGHCKQRWAKINAQVCKFVGCLKTATSQKSSGHNENDVMKLANQIYLNDHGVKFTLEHCWRELRHDPKWCALSSTIDDGKSKRRKCDDGHEASANSSSPYIVSDGEEQMARPPGVKASKAKAKRPVKGLEEDGKDLKEFQTMWEIKQKDFELKQTLNRNDFEQKQKLNKQKLLESLIAKMEPLSDIEMALKNKLINDMLSNDLS